MFTCVSGGFSLQISRGKTLFVPYADRGAQASVEIELHGNQRVPRGKLVASCDREVLSVAVLVTDGGVKFTLPLVQSGAPVERASTFRDLYHRVAEREVEAFTGESGAD